jgi:S-adenosylmethionine/arginine decarboxylase-like enzyme
METTAGRRVVYHSDALDAMASEEAIRNDYETQGAWGLLTSIDLHECNPDTIRSADEIKRFVRELCERIHMKRFGDTVVVDFGEDEKVAGYSMTQLIETSLISGHFANLNNATYLDIFSCKYYTPVEAAEFAKQFFGAKDYTLTYTLRK